MVTKDFLREERDQRRFRFECGLNLSRKAALRAAELRDRRIAVARPGSERLTSRHLPQLVSLQAPERVRWMLCPARGPELAQQVCQRFFNVCEGHEAWLASLNTSEREEEEQRLVGSALLAAVPGAHGGNRSLQRLGVGVVCGHDPQK